MPPFNTIVATEFTLPTYVFANGQVTGNPWNLPQNMFFVDGDVSSSNANAGAASDVTLGGYNFQYHGISIPQGAIITGIELEVIGYRGAQTSPVITLDISLYDNVDGANNFYPYSSGFTGLTPTMTTTVLGTPTYLFASTFTVDQINNLKVNLQANGDTNLDSFLVRVYFYIPAPATPPASNAGLCIDCESPIQIQAMYLELPFLSGQTKFYLKKGSFAYPNGTPVQPGDVGACGGKIPFVFDESKKKSDGNGGYEENAMLDTNTGSWTVLPSGVIEVDLGAVTQRGLDYKTPGTHVATLMSDHDANNKVIVSNNTPYNLTLVRRCQADTVFSPPINVQQGGGDVVNPVHTFNFFGGGVSVTQDGGDPFKANIFIAGTGVTPPLVVGVGSGTSGNVQVSSLTFPLTTSGTNRGVLVQISTEELQTVTSVTFNGVPLTQQIALVNIGDNLRTEQWFLVAPFLGTANVVITLSGAAYISAGAEAIVSVNQTTPIGATTSNGGVSLAPTEVINTTVDNSLVFDSLVTAQTPILYTTGPGQTSNWAHFANTDTRQGSSSWESAGTAPDAVTLDYTITQNTRWLMTGIEILGLAPSIGSQVGIQFEDEGVNLGTPGTVDEVDFTGAGVTASRAGNKVTVNIPGGAGTDEQVKVSGADTTAGYLQPKINVHSSDSSVTVSETITNPGGNEILDIDLTGAGGGGSGGMGSLLFSFTDTTGTTPPTNVPVTVTTYTIPANTFAIGDVFNLQVGTSITTNATNSGTISVELGGNVLTSMQSNAADGAQNDFIVTINGVVKAGNTLEYSLLKTRLLGGVESLEEVLSTGTIAFDPTVSNVIDFIVENTTNNGGLTGAFNNVSLERIGVGGSGLYNVNADESETQWWTTQIRAPYTDAFLTGSPWTVSGNCTQYGNASNSDANGAFTAVTRDGLFSTNNTGVIEFNSPNDWRIKFRLANDRGVGVSPLGGGVIWAFVGFAAAGTAISDGDITNTAQRYGFSFYNGRLYTIVADGSTVSAFDTGAYVTTTNQGYSMVYTPGVSVEFFINGTSVRVEPLLTQTAAVMKLTHNGANGSGGGSGGIISDFVFSQKV